MGKVAIWSFWCCFLLLFVSVYFILSQFVNAITSCGQAGQVYAIWPNNLEISSWVTVMQYADSWYRCSNVCHNMKGIHFTETQQNQINKACVLDWLQGLGERGSSHSIKDKKYLDQIKLKTCCDCFLSSCGVEFGRGVPFCFGILLMAWDIIHTVYNLPT